MPRVVVITGATSGIGRATVRRFAEPGVTLALLARNREALDAAVAEAQERGAEAVAYPLDVAEHAAVEAAADAVEAAQGPIDVWVNVAMTTVFAFFEDIEPDELRRATDVTYHGSVWGMRAALRRMLPRDSGTIVQVGSAMAYRGIPLQAPYCGAKHALKGVFETLRTELRHKGSNVHLTMVQLPGVNTPQFEHCRDKFDTVSKPVAPVYQPEVAADAVHWAAEHRRREIWVGLPTVYTVLGNRVAPWLVERYLAATAVGGQLTDKPKPADRQDNLMSSPSGDPGAHGPYDDESHAHSVQWWATRHRRALSAGALAAVAAGVGAAVRA